MVLSIAQIDACLEILWQLTLASSVVFLIVSSLNRFLPRRAANLRYALLSLVLMRLVVPPSVTSPVSIGHLLNGVSRIETARPPAHSEVQASQPIFWSDARAMPSAPVPSARIPWTQTLFVLWVLGVGVTACWLMMRRRAYRQLISRSEEITAGPPRETFDRWSRRFALRQPLRLVAGTEPVMPFTLGILHPVIYLPKSVWSGTGPAMIESVVAHELAHVKRCDDVGLILQQIVQSLFFFHPVVWMTTRAMRQECEISCDQLVLASGDITPRSYGQSLLRILGLQLTSTATVATMGPHGRLKMRLQQIIDDRPNRRLHSPLAVLCLSLATAATAALSPMTDADGQTSTSQPAAGSGVLSPTTAQLNPIPPFGANTPPPTLDDLMPGARVTSGFGMRRHPIDGDMVHHDGIDLTVGRQAAVFAPRGGRIELVEQNYGKQGRMGTVIVIDHGGGAKTFYAHLASVNVEAGSGVMAGDQIGIAGSTGVSTGPHLHFEIWIDDEKIDPTRIGEIVGRC